MITEFIGQGLNENPNQSTGNYIRTTLKDTQFTAITFFTAFLRKSGLDEIKKELVKKGRKITFFVGIDEQITSKESLEELLNLNIEAYIYNSKKFIFHPKFYLFEGDIKSRIILGSSNLTKAGLFYNVESSVLMDFTSEDKSGQKILSQLKNYFSPLFEFSSDNVDKVTKEHIEFLFQNGYISSEIFTAKGNEFKSTHDKSKNSKLPDIPELEDIVISEKSKPTNYNYELKITDEYLEKWDAMFIRMKNFKEKYQKTTVPWTYEDRTLYGWYKKQKEIYKHPILKMPNEHLDKLNSIKFYFGDGHKERERIIELNWLKVLKQALEEKDNIKINHGYKFNGEKLGTFLIGVKASNKKGKKLSLRKEIENIGFNFKDTSRKPKDVMRRFIDDLLNDINPSKVVYQTRFNQYIKTKEKLVTNELITEVNEAWLLQFNEKRTWEVKKRLIDRTEEWKKFRYDTKQNPKQKWYQGQTKMGSKLYHWVRKRKKDKISMDLIIMKFTETEVEELKSEGFPI